MKFWIVITLVVGAFMAFLVFGEKKTPGSTAALPPAGNFSTLVGKPAPNFSLQSLDGKTYSLSQWRGKKVVLFFNEGIMCYPACWNQMATLGTDQGLNNDLVVSASIVPDAQSDWTDAMHKMPELAKGTILLDSNTTTSSSYGVLSLPSSMHRGMKPGHTYVIIDQNGIVRYTKDDPNMGINNTTLKQEVNKL